MLSFAQINNNIKILENNKIENIHADVEKKEIIVKGSKSIIDSIKATL